jgi:hypothetical protein
MPVVAGMGPCERPDSTGEGTETLAYEKAVPAIRDQASALQTPDLLGADIGCPFDRCALRNVLLTVRLDDRYPPITQPER